MSKQGLSSLNSTVLIIGFIVVLGTFVMVWGYKFVNDRISGDEKIDYICLVFDNNLTCGLEGTSEINNLITIAMGNPTYFTFLNATTIEFIQTNRVSNITEVKDGII
jgi:hypothetical protein